MIGTLIRKELLTNLLTGRLAVAFVATVVLAVGVTVVASLDYSARMQAYRTARQQTEEALRQATIYAQVAPDVHLPPQPLSIFGLGVEAWVGNSLLIRGNARYEAPPVVDTLSNDFLKTLAPVDFTTVVALVLSFLAVTLGFDGLCGERESGTLSQVLSNPVPRAHVIAAKLVGGWLSLWIPLAVAFGLSLGVVLANPDVTLRGEDGLRLGLFFLLSGLFLAQVFAFSLLVSSWVQQSATSLILCLFGWLALGVVWMNLAPAVAEFGRRETPWQVYVDGAEEAYRQYQQAMAEWDRLHPSPGQAYLEGYQSNGVLRFAHPQGYAWRQQRTAFQVDQQLALTDADYRLRWAVHAERAEQALSVDRWALLSPLANYRVLCYQVARTTMADKFFLAQAGQRYRESFLQYLRGKGAFTSRRWFTDDPEHQEPMIREPEAVTDAMRAPESEFLRQRLAWARQANARVEREGGRRLDLRDLPAFQGGYRILGESLAMMASGLAVLGLSLALAVAATVWRFRRMEPW